MPAKSINIVVLGGEPGEIKVTEISENVSVACFDLRINYNVRDGYEKVMVDVNVPCRLYGKQKVDAFRDLASKYRMVTVKGSIEVTGSGTMVHCNEYYFSNPRPRSEGRQDQ